MNRFVALALCALLTACGGGGTGNVDIVPTSPAPGTPTPPVVSAPSVSALQSRLDAAAATRTAVSRLPLTTVANIPTAGSATFSGPALITAKRGAINYEMIGDSRLTMNFGTRQMGGNITNVAGRRGNGSTFAAPGQITYSTGQFPTGGSRLFAVDYNGRVNAGGDQIALRGEAIGSFSGNRSSGPIRTTAIQAVDGSPGSDVAKATGLPNMTATVNGQAAVGQILIVGQN